MADWLVGWLVSWFPVWLDGWLDPYLRTEIERACWLGSARAKVQWQKPTADSSTERAMLVVPWGKLASLAIFQLLLLLLLDRFVFFKTKSALPTNRNQ